MVVEQIEQVTGLTTAPFWPSLLRMGQAYQIEQVIARQPYADFAGSTFDVDTSDNLHTGPLFLNLNTVFEVAPAIASVFVVVLVMKDSTAPSISDDTADATWPTGLTWTLQASFHSVDTYMHVWTAPTGGDVALNNTTTVVIPNNVQAVAYIVGLVNVDPTLVQIVTTTGTDPVEATLAALAQADNFVSTFRGVGITPHGGASALVPTLPGNTWDGATFTQGTLWAEYQSQQSASDAGVNRYVALADGFNWSDPNDTPNLVGPPLNMGANTPDAEKPTWTAIAPFNADTVLAVSIEWQRT